MASFSDIGILLGDVSLLEIEHFTKNPMKAQKSTLKKILGRNKNCEIGKKYDFKNIKSIEEYQANVPLSFYEDYVPYVERMIHNKEKNLMFTGPNIRYCSSSGSVGKPKILPKSVKDLWNMQCIDKQRPDWNEVKLGIMEELLRLKLEQNPYVKKKLLQTENYLIVEDSPKDSFWGWGPNRDGENQLGKLWMKLREELKNEL